MSNLLKLFKESLSTFIFQILLFFLALINNIIITRILGPAGKGEYDVIITFTLVVRMISLLGLEVAAVNFLGSKKIDKHIITFNVFFIGIISTLLFSTLSLIFWSYFNIGYDLESYLFISTVPLSGLMLLSNYFLLGSDKVLNYNIIESGKNFFYLFFLTLLLLLLGLNYTKISVCYFFSIFSTFALGIYFLIRHSIINLEWRNFSLKCSKELLSFAKYPYISGFISFLVYRADVFIVNIILGKYATGIYGIAVLLIESMNYISKSIQLVILAKIPRFESVEGRDSVIFIVKTVFIVLLFLGIIFVLYGKFFILLIFGADFVESSKLIIYLVPGIIILGINKVISSYFIAKGWVKIFILINSCALTLNILLDIIYVPLYKLTAASISTSIAYFSSFIIILIYFLNKEKLPLSVFLPKKNDFKIIKDMFFGNKKQISK